MNGSNHNDKFSADFIRIISVVFKQLLRGAAFVFFEGLGHFATYHELSITQNFRKRLKGFQNPVWRFVQHDRMFSVCNLCKECLPPLLVRYKADEFEVIDWKSRYT